MATVYDPKVCKAYMTMTDGSQRYATCFEKDSDSGFINAVWKDPTDEVTILHTYCTEVPAAYLQDDGQIRSPAVPLTLTTAADILVTKKRAARPGPKVGVARPRVGVVAAGSNTENLKMKMMKV